jgi:hypothetical protein
MAAKAKVQSDDVIVNEADEFEGIQTCCPKCGKESTVRGLNWSDLKEAGVQVDEAVVINRLCANCSYRLSAAKKPMSEAQKQARKRYNQLRRDRIKEALALLEQSEQE